MTQEILIAAVGNSRLRLGHWARGEVVDACSMVHDEIDGPTEQVNRIIASSDGCVLAGVHQGAAERFERTVRKHHPGCEVMRIGTDIPVRIRHSLDDASTVGQDRLLNAIAAFGRARQACVIVDMGTAITVDFVDGEGVFHGGVIAPGVRMMLDALQEHTDGLPKVSFEMPDPARGPFGKDTPHAMRLGVLAAVAGLVRIATERYAEFYGAYPQVVATGGDAGLLEQEEGLVEHIVPDLQLLGIGLCIDRAAEGDED